MMGFSQTSLAIQLTTVVVPVAVYFLVIGLLNTRRCPQVLSGRQDFALLFVAICPLFVLPILDALGHTGLAMAVAAGVVVAGIGLLAPRGRTWVIYNIRAARGREIASKCLDRMGAGYRAEKARLILDDGRGQVLLGGFAMLKNVSIRLEGFGDADADDFQRLLHQNLGRCEAEPNPMAVGLLMVATAMLVAPVTFMAHRGVPELVRMLTGLLN